MKNFSFNRYSNEKEIKNQWENLVSGKKVNQEIVPGIIYKSWERSLNFGVNPYKLENILLTEKERKLEILKYKKLLRKYGEIIKVIKEIAQNKNWSVQIFDKNAKNLYCISDSLQINLSKIIANNVSENKIGTNSICLAIKERRPIQIKGPEHFNLELHNVYCSSAPIFDEKNELVAIINIASINKKQNMETISLVTSFAKVITNKNIINKMNEELTLYNDTLNEIIKYFPQGILYINDKNEIENYNNKVLDIFNITENKKNEVKSVLFEYIKNMKLLEIIDINDKEIFLDYKNTKKSLLVSTNKFEKGKLIIIKETNDIIKLNNLIKKKNAYYTFDDIISRNEELKNIINIAKRISKTNVPILLHGESGTGKELFAQSIHKESFRKNKSFVPINCGAIPSELIESELFGYEPGSFTGGLKNGKIGKLEFASGGTVFLDEVDSMPLNVQVKLLRALSANSITRIGGKKEIEIDIRLISATKKDLFSEIQYGNFREDFYYRINTIILKIPPLRKRKDDIPLIIDYFINYYKEIYNFKNIKITDDYLEAMIMNEWKGNVRELRHVIERSIVLANNNKFNLEVLPDYILENYRRKYLDKNLQDININELDKGGLLNSSEKLLILNVLKNEEFNISKTAKKLGISRPTLYKRLKMYDIKTM